MKLLEVFVSKDYDFIISVDSSVIFAEPLENVDALYITALLCKSFNIPTGEETLLMYNFLEEKFIEIKAEKEESIMNKRFFSKTA